LVRACPTPNLDPALTPPVIARQRGLSPRDGRQQPFGSRPRERESRGRDVTKEFAMTENKSFKRRVRERMTKTGESYTAARSQVSKKRDRNKAARARLAAADERIADAKLKEATGKSWIQWFSILDRWGAKGRKHSEIARYLGDERDVPGWWAQTITVGYERARGMRLKYQQASGFSVTASKTVWVPVDVLFDAFLKPARRRKWLHEGSMRVRTSQPGRSARFDWEDGSTRVIADFLKKGPSKSMVAVTHERLPDADEAETTKAAWRQRLTELKSYLES
jgi:hypothetical protein